MTEAVRFYWLTGEAEVPFDAIPEGDRSPLRVRVTVAQTHAPTAAAQLAGGRFVTAAWSDSGGLRMILCPPDLARGGADALLVDPSALPRLFVKFPRSSQLTSVRHENPRSVRIAFPDT